jgi:hypothetical protein
MGITHFPHGIIAFPNIGGGSGAFGYSTDSITYFVDGNNGLDDNDGTSPERAYKTVYRALNTANAWDVIYVLPLNWTSGNLWLGTAYQDTANALSITYAKTGLALIGLAHQSLLGGPPYGTIIKELASSTAPILKVHAPMVAIENIGFERGGTAVNSLYFYGDVAGTSEAALGSVYNCYFYYGTGSGADGSTGGAVHGDATWGLTVDNCTFFECRHGIAVKSNAGTAGNFIFRNNNFFSRLTSASGISADIYVYTQGSTSLLIENNKFAHLIPSYAGGHSKWIYIDADVRQGLITNNHCGGAVGTVYTQGYGGTGISVPTNVGLGINYCNGQAMPVVSA